MSPDAANGASATPPVEEATPTGTVIPIQAEPAPAAAAPAE
jgi:hypothetical protein